MRVPWKLAGCQAQLTLTQFRIFEEVGYSGILQMAQRRVWLLGYTCASANDCRLRKPGLLMCCVSAPVCVMFPAARKKRAPRVEKKKARVAKQES